MEWVETTGRSVEEAKERALDQLGVAEDDAEFELLEEPRPGLFGRVRGIARVRARVRPMQPRPKVERRERKGRRGAPSPSSEQEGTGVTTGAPSIVTAEVAGNGDGETASSAVAEGSRSTARNHRDGKGAPRRRSSGRRPTDGVEHAVNAQEDQQVDAERVGDEARAFVDKLVEAFGLEATSDVRTEGTDIDVVVEGADLGLLVGPRGVTLLAIQDLTRVAAQRRLGDHETRLRIDIAGYRERRRQALARFAAQVADEVADAGVARALEPMPSADRKVIHDVLTEDPRVVTRSEGEDPLRRVVVAPVDA